MTTSAPETKTEQHDQANTLPAASATPTPEKPKVLCWRLDDNEKNINRLTDSLNRLLRSYPKLRAHFSGSEDPVIQFLDQFFPQDLQVRYFAANLSFTDESHKKISLALRAPNHGMFYDLLPENVAICVRGYWPVQSGSPIFKPEYVFVTHNDDAATSLEKELEVTPSKLEEGHYPARGIQNALTPTLAQSLPPISVEAGRRLESWKEFLEFKRKLVTEKTCGLRYLVWELNKESQLRFLVVAASLQDIQQTIRIFGRRDLQAFALTVSTDLWRFRLPDVKDNSKKNKQPSGFELAQVKGKIEPIDLKEHPEIRKSFEADPKESPDSKLELAWVSVDWVEDLKNQLDAIDVDDVEKHNEFLQYLKNQIPASGFLSFPSVGDLALINRHERAINNLRQNENCFSPYLSSYLFDIKKAGVPDTLPRIDEWFNNDLNDAQKRAVQKMLAAPDLCLIQGPPGTGKTTVIAEAILQLVSQGETVLLASQSHDAIDNALSKIRNRPELRAVRLARDQKKITDEGKQFSGSQSLARYYDSLRSYVYDKEISPYQQQLNTLKQQQQWLEQAEFVEADLQKVTKTHNDLSQKIQQHKELLHTKRQQYSVELERYTDQNYRCQLLRQFLGFLQHEEVAPLALPLPVEADRLAYRLLDLAQIQVRLAFSRETFISDTTSRMLILQSLLDVWARLQGKRQQMERDLARLKALGTKILRDSSIEAEIEALKIKETQLSDAMETDDSAMEQWRMVRGEIRALEKKAGGLELSTYEIFADSELFTKISNTCVVTDLLAARLAFIDLLESQILEAKQQVAVCIDAKIMAETPIEPSDKALKTCESDIAHLQFRQMDEYERLKELQDKATNLLVQMNFPRDADFAARVVATRAYLHDCKEHFQHLQMEEAPWQAFLADWESTLTESDAEMDWEALDKTFSESCNLYAISCNESDQTLQNAGVDSFDVAIIDEVSKATPIEMLLPLMRARRAVLVGDHRQLPPIFQESQDAQTFADMAEQSEENKEESSRTSLTRENTQRFEKMVTASLFKELFESAPDAIRERLTEQFRMHPDIMRVVNNFYEGQLACGNPEKVREHHLNLIGKNNTLLAPHHHMLWIDTSYDQQGKPVREAEHGTNPIEAQLIAQTLIEINAQMRKQGFNKQNKQKIGVVSFYAAQCGVIRKEVKKRASNGFDAIDVEINTVIRYQGKEKPIVLISLVRNDGQSKEKRRSARANVARFEFINVAMSRAQNLLIVFGARNMLELREVNLPKMDAQGTEKRLVYRDIFSELDRAARIFPASEILIGAGK